MATHQMKLKSEYFKHILRGTKTVECRLFDEKRKLLKVGDIIEFSDASAPHKKLLMEISALHLFPSFSALFDHFPANSFGGEKKDEFIFNMEKIYPREEEKKYGVIAIELKK